VCSGNETLHFGDNVCDFVLDNEKSDDEEGAAVNFPFGNI
jgi:hypothetical protein